MWHTACVLATFVFQVTKAKNTSFDTQCLEQHYEKLALTQATIHHVFPITFQKTVEEYKTSLLN